MHVVLIRAKLHDVQQASLLLPLMKPLHGFVSAQWVGLSDVSGIAVVAFETEAAANAAVELMQVSPPQPEVMSIEGVEMGEVLAQV